MIVIIIFVLLYNSLINRRNRVEYAFGGVDALLKKRADLIPNLVKTVKAYMKHEKDVLATITSLRAEVIQKDYPDAQRFKTEDQLSILLKRLNISVENYPHLKASENFLHLQSTLQDLEEHIAAARRAYNAAVYDYNNGIEMFPFSIVAAIMNYQKKTFFEVSEKEKNTPISISEKS